MPLDTTSRLLAPFLDHLTVEELDAVPYGVVQLDLDGRVLSYNTAEAENVGAMPRPLGRHFFFEVAPSANVPEFYGRFLEGVAAQRLDDTFNFTFSCALMPRRVMVRQYYSMRTGSVWLFVGQPDGSAFTRHTASHGLSAVRETPAYGVEQVASRVA
ncbi:hypothetical protein [Gemmatimonas sp.]|uniref:hypothetical protein n=1 Tax=Gemmatimonas sp. TaxID=1962908 RepID=UPI003983989A